MATSRGGAASAAAARPATPRTPPPVPAYVLHGWDWSESSLILDVFTRAQGRLVVVAKGAKKPTSNFRPVLLPFHLLTLWLSKPGADSEDDVRTLRAAEWAGSAPLPGAVLMSGFYLNELLMKGLARHDPHARLFDAYAETLAALAEGTEEGAALRAFELVFLRELGVLPELDAVTLTTEPVRPQGRYSIRPEVGVVPDADGPEGAAWVGLQAALTHGSLAALRQACRPQAAALRGPLRALVHYHLGSARLRTREVWLGMQRLAEPASR